MRVYYETEDNKVLCFNHAVRTALNDNEVIHTIVEGVSHAHDDPYDSVVGFPPPCDECSLEEEKDYQEVADDQMKKAYDDTPEEEIDDVPF